MQKLLSRLEGGLSVRGFFPVDRGIFPSLVGFFLTYLVLFVQLRAGDGGSGNALGNSSSLPAQDGELVAELERA